MAGQETQVLFYTGLALPVRTTPGDLSLLEQAYREGYRYAIIDDEAYVVPKRRAVASAIEQKLKPIASFPDTLKQGPMFVLEHSEFVQLDLEASLDLYRQIRAARGPSEARIYDLEPLFRQ